MQFPDYTFNEDDGSVEVCAVITTVNIECDIMAVLGFTNGVKAGKSKLDHKLYCMISQEAQCTCFICVVVDN